MLSEWQIHYLRLWPPVLSAPLEQHLGSNLNGQILLPQLLRLGGNMALENKCREHWKALGIMSTENLKEFIATLFTKHDHQEDVLIELYKLVLPEWDEISKIKGYPEIGNDMWLYIC